MYRSIFESSLVVPSSFVQVKNDGRTMSGSYQSKHVNKVQVDGKSSTKGEKDMHEENYLSSRNFTVISVTENRAREVCICRVDYHHVRYTCRVNECL